jgi:hypothetical protein
MRAISSSSSRSFSLSREPRGFQQHAPAAVVVFRDPENLRQRQQRQQRGAVGFPPFLEHLDKLRGLAGGLRHFRQLTGPPNLVADIGGVFVEHRVKPFGVGQLSILFEGVGEHRFDFDIVLEFMGGLPQRLQRFFRVSRLEVQRGFLLPGRLAAR